MALVTRVPASQFEDQSEAVQAAVKAQIQASVAAQLAAGEGPISRQDLHDAVTGLLFLIGIIEHNKSTSDDLNTTVHVDEEIVWGTPFHANTIGTVDPTLHVTPHLANATPPDGVFFNRSDVPNLFVTAANVAASGGQLTLGEQVVYYVGIDSAGKTVYSQLLDGPYILNKFPLQNGGVYTVASGRMIYTGSPYLTWAGSVDPTLSGYTP